MRAGFKHMCVWQACGTRDANWLPICCSIGLLDSNDVAPEQNCRQLWKSCTATLPC